MSSKAATPAGASELERARGREQAAYLSIRVLAVAAISFVVTASFQAQPAPGGHGAARGVAAVLIVFCGATIAAMWLPQARPAVQLAVLLGILAFFLLSLFARRPRESSHRARLARTRLAEARRAVGMLRDDALPGPGYGLTGMRERAELPGGTLTPGPADGGFQVQLWVPA